MSERWAAPDGLHDAELGVQPPNNNLARRVAVLGPVLAVVMIAAACANADSSSEKTNTPTSKTTTVRTYVPNPSETLTNTPQVEETPVTIQTPEPLSQKVIRECTPSLLADKLSAKDLKTAKADLANYTQFLSISGHNIVETPAEFGNIKPEDYMHLCMVGGEPPFWGGVNVKVDGVIFKDYDKLVEVLKDSDGRINKDTARGLPFARGMTQSGNHLDGNVFALAKELEVTDLGDRIEVKYHLPRMQNECDAVVVGVDLVNGAIDEIGPVSGHKVNGLCQFATPVANLTSGGNIQ